MTTYLENLWKEADAAWSREPAGAEWLACCRRILAFATTCIGQG
jgi:hypothetical protein